MTLNKIIISLLAIIMMSSCSKDNFGNIPVGDVGYHLVCNVEKSEQIFAYHNAYKEEKTDTTLANLIVKVRPYTSSHNTAEKDEKLETLIKKYLDPDGTLYNGDMPISVEYRNETCKDIKLQLFDKNDNLISNLTDSARFDYIEGDVGHNLLINSEGNHVESIKIGFTIKEYLASNPRIFPVAHFVFVNTPKSTFDNGNYVRTDIVLNNGVTLTSKSSAQYSSSDE